jgi:hypothetical protein
MTVRLSNLTSRWAPGSAPNIAFNMQVRDGGADPQAAKFYNYSLNGSNRIVGYANGRIHANSVSTGNNINVNAGAVVLYSNGLIVGVGSLFVTGNINAGGIIVSSNSPIDLSSVTLIANLAYDKANAANVAAATGQSLFIANLAFDKANSGNQLANIVFGVANNANLYANLAFRAANAAFALANSTDTATDAAFLKANNASSNGWTDAVLQQNFGTASSSLVDITGLSIPAASNKDYHFVMRLRVRANSGVAATAGYTTGLNFPTGCYPQGWQSILPQSNTSIGGDNQSVDGTGDHNGTATGTPGAGIPVLALFEGFVAMRTNASGSIQARFSTEGAVGYVVLANSTISYKTMS